MMLWVYVYGVAWCCDVGGGQQQIHVRPAGRPGQGVAQRVAHLPLRGGVARHRAQAPPVGGAECRLLRHRGGFA